MLLHSYNSEFYKKTTSLLCMIEESEAFKTLVNMLVEKTIEGDIPSLQEFIEKTFDFTLRNMQSHTLGQIVLSVIQEKYPSTERDYILRTLYPLSMERVLRAKSTKHTLTLSIINQEELFLSTITASFFSRDDKNRLYFNYKERDEVHSRLKSYYTELTMLLKRRFNQNWATSPYIPFLPENYTSETIKRKFLRDVEFFHTYIYNFLSSSSNSKEFQELGDDLIARIKENKITKIDDFFIEKKDFILAMIVNQQKSLGFTLDFTLCKNIIEERLLSYRTENKSLFVNYALYAAEGIEYLDVLKAAIHSKNNILFDSITKETLRLNDHLQELSYHCWIGIPHLKAYQTANYLIYLKMALCFGTIHAFETLLGYAYLAMSEDEKTYLLASAFVNYQEKTSPKDKIDILLKHEFSFNLNHINPAFDGLCTAYAIDIENNNNALAPIAFGFLKRIFKYISCNQPKEDDSHIPLLQEYKLYCPKKYLSDLEELIKKNNITVQKAKNPSIIVDENKINECVSSNLPSRASSSYSEIITTTMPRSRSCSQMQGSWTRRTEQNSDSPSTQPHHR